MTYAFSLFISDCVYRSEELDELPIQTQLNESSHPNTAADYCSKRELKRSELHIFPIRPQYSDPRHLINKHLNSDRKIPHNKPRFNVYSESQVPKDLSRKPEFNELPIPPHLEITPVPKQLKKKVEKESAELPARLAFDVLPVQTELEELPAPTEIVDCKAVSFILYCKH